MNHSEFIKVKEVPLHKALGLQFSEPKDGQSIVTMTVDDRHVNTAGVFHGGLIYAFCDITAFVALISLMEEGQMGVTNSISIQVMRPVAKGSEVEFHGNVIKLGRRMAFVETTAISNGKVIAKASITKTMI